MGRRLDGFDIELQFDGDGGVRRIEYHDSEGCGHSKQVSGETPLIEVIRYHLEHYKKSHEMEPPRRCPATFVIEGLPVNQRVRCTLEPHEPTTPHNLQVQ